MIWYQIHPRAHPDHLGFIPSFLREDDPRPARDQFAEQYIGGWSPFKGFKKLEDGSLLYKGDPPLEPLYEAHLRNEHITVYRHAWVTITQPDGTFEVSRMD